MDFQVLHQNKTLANSIKFTHPPDSENCCHSIVPNSFLPETEIGLSTEWRLHLNISDR